MPDTSIDYFRFAGSSIKKMNFSNSFIGLPENIKKKLDVDYTVDDINRHENDIYGLLTLTVNVRFKNKDGACNIKLQLQGFFVGSSTYEDERFDEMLQINGSALLYSMARSIIQSFSAQAFIGEALAIPLINTQALYEQKKAEQN